MNSRADNADNRLSDFSQDKRIILLSLIAVVIGVVSAFVAYGLMWLIAVITNISFYHVASSLFRSPSQNQLGLLVIIVPILGGLAIGLMARYGSDRIRGHGIPEALEAILFGQSRMEPKVALLKPLSSAISIGTGGPFGAEGPIIMTGGAFGSIIGQWLHLSASERKTLLVAGAAGGMAAIFASPVASVLLAVELLLFEWRPRSVVPVAIAATIAFALRIPLLGPGPVFPIASVPSLGAEGLGFAVLVGLASGLCSGALTTLVYWFEDLFGKIPIHWMWWPAIAGLGIGLGGLVDPRILGVGYDTIRDLLRGDIIGWALVGVLLGKSLVWAFALGSGTSGGVLAPLLMIGAALGAAESHLIPIGNAGVWALVSMAAVMGGTMRSPLTALIFALELTRQIDGLPLLLIACMTAYAVTVLLMRRSILTEKVARRGYHITREYGIDPLAVVRVAEVMDPNPPAVDDEMRVSELTERIAAHDPELTRHQALPILNSNGKLAGIITRGDLLRIVNRPENQSPTVLQAGTIELVVTFPDETVHEALTKMIRHNIGRLPVVSRDDPSRLEGYLGRVQILAARSRQLDEEHIRERNLRLQLSSK